MASFGSIFSFVLMGTNDNETEMQEAARATGGAREVAAMMRAAADRIDPPVKDPSVQLGEKVGEQLVHDLFGSWIKGDRGGR